MKPKNIMLLGFVNRAVEYIDKHMDEEPDARLAELKNIDLASIKDELADNLDLSLGTMQSTMSTLLKAGNEAFDRFIENHSQKSIYDEINSIFDEDKDKQKEEEDLVLNNQDKLANLLSFYNLEDDFDIEEESEEEEKHVEESKEEVVENKEETEEEVKENKEEVVEEETEYELSPEDHELMQEIAKNASSEDDTRPLPLHYDKKTNEDIDSIFNEIIENENNDKVDDTNVESTKQNDEGNELVDQLFEELPPIDTTLINELLDKIITVKDDEEIVEPKLDETVAPVNEDDNNDVLGNSELIQNIIESSLNQDEEAVEEVKETEQPLTEEINDVNSSEIVENIIENSLNQEEDINDNSEELIVEDDTNEEVSSADEDTNIPEDATTQNEDVNDSVEEEPIEENEFINDFNDYLEPVYHEVIENPLVDIHIEEEDTTGAEEAVDDEVVEKEETADTTLNETVDIEEPVAGKVIENPLVDVHLDEPTEEETVDIVEPVVEEDSNVETTEEDVNNEVESEEKVEETVEDTNDNEKPYVSTLIDDLKKQLVVEEDIKKQKEEKNKEIYDRISRMYPYLSKSFVKTVFDLKEDFARGYSNGQKVVVLHRIKFMNVDNLRQFAEIALNHDYLINVDENKLIVDIFKQFDNSDGKILANIYEIANQGCLLNGTYEGYNVIINE